MWDNNVFFRKNTVDYKKNLIFSLLHFFKVKEVAEWRGMMNSSWCRGRQTATPSPRTPTRNSSAGRIEKLLRLEAKESAPPSPRTATRNSSAGRIEKFL
jgi:hypothetical protein